MKEGSSFFLTKTGLVPSRFNCWRVSVTFTWPAVPIHTRPKNPVRLRKAGGFAVLIVERFRESMGLRLVGVGAAPRTSLALGWALRRPTDGVDERSAPFSKECPPLAVAGQFKTSKNFPRVVYA